MPAPAVVIAATDLMPSLRERLADDGELITFTDSQPIEALQTILERRPPLVVLERLFAATPRGAALINRLKNDPQLGHAELRVMSHTGDYRRIVTRPALVPAPTMSPAAADATAPTGGHADTRLPSAPAPRPLDWHGTRRAPRHRVRDGVEIQLDGNPARIIDLSQVGAQVLSGTILRPNQRVRVSIPGEEFVMRFRGSIAWAKFELPQPTEPPRYRAGVEFTDADPEVLDEFCQKHKEG